jgi:hypothetical protein
MTDISKFDNVPPQGKTCLRLGIVSRFSGVVMGVSILLESGHRHPCPFPR